MLVLITSSSGLTILACISLLSDVKGLGAPWNGGWVNILGYQDTHTHTPMHNVDSMLL